MGTLIRAISFTFRIASKLGCLVISKGEAIVETPLCNSLLPTKIVTVKALNFKQYYFVKTTF